MPVYCVTIEATISQQILVVADTLQEAADTANIMFRNNAECDILKLKLSARVDENDKLPFPGQGDYVSLMLG